MNVNEWRKILLSFKQKSCFIVHSTWLYTNYIFKLNITIIELSRIIKTNSTWSYWMKQRLSFNKTKFHWAKNRAAINKIVNNHYIPIPITFANTLRALSCFFKLFIALEKVSNCSTLTCKYILGLLSSKMVNLIFVFVVAASRDVLLVRKVLQDHPRQERLTIYNMGTDMFF